MKLRIYCISQTLIYLIEWELTENILHDPGYIPELCFVALCEDGIVGYVLLSRAKIGADEGLTLGPIAVKPSFQGKGIGKKLVEQGLKKAKELNFDWVALTGGDYYTQFGFEPALKYDIIIDDNHPENPYLKIKFLNKGKKISGKIRFSDSFYDGNGNLL